MDSLKLFVMLGYGEEFGLTHRSLDFRTEQMDTNTAVQVVSLIESYNDYDGVAVAGAIETMAKLWTSDYQQISFTFGRAGSPVLYVHFPYWADKTQKMDQDDRAHRIELSKKILQSTQPDEVDETMSGLRLWWD